MGSPGAFSFDRGVVGDFELVAKLATGGMAEIFLARRRGVTADVNGLFVIKRILGHLAEDEHFVQMFRDEAELASSIVHPNVCRVYGIDCDRGVWFMVMEYLHGMPLSRIMALQSRTQSPFTPAQLTALMHQACAGLGFAHNLADVAGHPLGIVHRDISPPNLYVTTEGDVKILDFGIAKAKTSSSRTRTGTIKGKNAYMSPEQILGRTLDHRSDVFALGAVLWELITLRRLFHRESDFTTFKAITEEPVPDVRVWCPQTPPAIAAVVAKALSRAPEDRFASCREFADALAAATGAVADRRLLADTLASSFHDEIAAKDAVVRDAYNAPAYVDPSGSGRMHATVLESGSSPGSSGKAFQAAAQAAFAQEFDNARAARISANGTQLSHQLEPANADLRHASRQRAQMWIGAGLAFVALVTCFALFVTQQSPGKAQASEGIRARPASKIAPAGANGDVVASPDSDAAARAMPKRDEIEALSKFGFWNFSSATTVVVFINGKRIGETPFERHALPPGYHDVKLVGPKGKTATFRIAIYGGQETTTPMWRW